MNPKEIRERYNTLTKAVDRIEELETELEQTHQNVFKAATVPKPAPPPPRGSVQKVQQKRGSW